MLMEAVPNEIAIFRSGFIFDRDLHSLQYPLSLRGGNKCVSLVSVGLDRNVLLVIHGCFKSLPELLESMFVDVKGFL